MAGWLGLASTGQPEPSQPCISPQLLALGCPCWLAGWLPHPLTLWLAGWLAGWLAAAASQQPASWAQGLAAISLPYPSLLSAALS